MPAHLAAKCAARLSEFGLDERVTRLPHQRLSPGILDRFGQQPCAFDVIEDLGAGIAGQDIPGKKNHLPVRPDDLTRVSDDSQAVTVAVKSKPQVGFLVAHGFDQLYQIIRDAGVWMMIGEGAVNLTVKLNNLATDVPHELWSRHTGDAIPAVRDYLERTLEMDISRNPLHIGRNHVFTSSSSLTFCKGLCFNAFA